MEKTGFLCKNDEYQPMDIQFLYCDACPSHAAGLARLRAVLAAEGISAPVKIIRVATEAEAQALRFVGSPTILIDGHDIVPPAPDSPYRLDCRVYHWDDGRISPLPAEPMIRAALRAAAQRAADS
jgi:hypothetical protein